MIEHYVIYERPGDYPDHFVVRRWVITKGEILCERGACLAKDLAGARKLVPDGLICIERDENDARPIVEVWM